MDNKFMVGLQGGSVVILKPSGVALCPIKLSVDDALLLAAHIILIADEETGEDPYENDDGSPRTKFDDILAALIKDEF